jgi:translocation and assembly module TamA
VDNIAEPRETFFVAALPLFAQHDTSDDLLDPTTGIRLSGELSPEISRSEGQQSVYLRSRFDLSGYQPVSDTVVIAGRVAFGAISGTELDNIAPSRRLYAGGGGSVRGFGFREIGPRDEEDDPSGGRSLVEGAIEARIQTGLLDGAVSVVPFVDAGSVSQSVRPDFAEVKFGAGLGLRYNSGFGSLRLDVGVPLNPSPTDSPVAVYVSLGQAF